jgi:outer membrane immunogenic protein
MPYVAKAAVEMSKRRTASATLNSRWVTTATAKLGCAWDRVLLYGKGGGAWVGANNPKLTVNGAPVTLSSSTTNNFGWTAGIGIEWAFAGNWSARAEYDFIGLQNQSLTVPGTVTPGTPFGGDTLNFNNRKHQHVHRRLELQVRWLGLLVTPEK